MKLHRTLVQAVVDTLMQIFTKNIYADIAIDGILRKNPRWGARDRRFIAETTYEMVRWWRLIGRSVEQENPQTAADFWKLLASFFVINEGELPTWKEFEGIDKTSILENYHQAQKNRKYRESIPDWLDELGNSELGTPIWEKELHELNKEAKVVLRVNTLKTNRFQLQQLLNERAVETTVIGDYPDALVLTKRQSLQQLAEYKQGLFEIQDASSQLIAPFMDLKPGMLVIDTCAGAGGKSLHIAAIMQNKGKIISMDVEEKKLVLLQKRADRASAGSIETKVVNENTLSQLKNSADRLLLDVPCSGLGVIRRNPDTKWKLNFDFITKVKKTQQDILTNYSQLLKPGGTMVYATCSILPSENQEQIELFLNKNGAKFEFIEDRKVLPSEGFDGFYMSKIKRL